MQLEVIYDPTKQLATLVDMDAGIGYGPVMPGAEAGDILTGWLEGIPFDLEGVPSELARDFFHRSIERVAQTTAQPSPPGAQEPASPPDGGTSAQAAQAVREAQDGSAGPPPPQPADTDPTAAGAGSTSSASGADTAGGSPAPAPPAGPDSPPPAAGAAGPAPTDAAAQAATTSRPCPNCNGTGNISYNDGTQTVANTCTMCQGAGTVEVPA